MQAGQGGIRYNDSLKFIQIMDTNNNWINYKRYDNNSNLNLEIYNRTTSFTHVFDKVGLYILLIIRGYQGGTINTTTNASQSVIFNNSGAYTSNSNAIFLSYINANVGDTITATYPSGGYGQGAIMYYISGKYTTASYNNHVTAGDNGQNSLSLANATNRVLIAITNGGSPGNRSISIDTTNLEYNTDGANYGCVSTVDNTASVTMRVTVGYNFGTMAFFDLQIS